MASPQACHALSTHYVNLYERRYNRKPLINRNSARWSWDSMLEDLTSAEIKELLEFYFSVPSAKHHALDTFFWNYEKIAVTYQTVKKDREHRKKLSIESAARVVEWEKRLERIKSNQRSSD